MRLAFTANNLDYRLNGNASEFVNALRGFHEARKARKVSRIFEEAKPFSALNELTQIMGLGEDFYPLQR